MAEINKPNIVFVLTDDQGYGDLGCHGNEVIQTPNIDRFHSESVRFTDFHVGTTCAPTRAGLLTGHWCNSAGVWHTIGGHSLLPEDEWTLANAFSEAGYRTGHFGKWHLGDTQPFRPHERGFETSIYHAGGGIGNTGDAWGNDYFDDTYFANGVPTKFNGYCTDVFFTEAMRFIEQRKDEPFFCYIALNAPHGPYNVEPRYRDLYGDRVASDDRARFYGMITNIDENFGRLRDQLETLGLSDNTILVFMTDNGTSGGVDLDEDGFPLEGAGGYNAGMRGLKGSPYEGGHRVPFLIRYPAAGAVGGRDVNALSSYVDFMPTLLEMCGIESAQERSFHGTSLAPLVTGSSDDRRGAVADLLATRVVVSDTQRVPRPVKWRNSSVMKRKWRLLSGKELYDLSTDPGQRHDVATEHPDIVAELRSGYEEWWEIVSQQMHRDKPIALGADDQTVAITTHDIRNEEGAAAWNQRQVRSGHVCSGYWSVEAKRPGTYRFELRRWPEETGYEITAGIDGDDVEWRSDAIQERHRTHYSGGTALPIEWARLEIGGTISQVEVVSSEIAASFDVQLAAGSDKLYAAFYDRKERTIAPYYVGVTRIGKMS